MHIHGGHGELGAFPDVLVDVADSESEHALLDQGAFFKSQFGAEIQKAVMLGINVHLHFVAAFGDKLFLDWCQKVFDNAFAAVGFLAVDPINGEDIVKQPAEKKSRDPTVDFHDVEQGLFVSTEFFQCLPGEVGLQNPPHLFLFLRIDFIDQSFHQ